MKDLKVNELVDTVEEHKVNDFVNSIDSKMRVQTEYSKDGFNNEWLDIFEFTMPYLEKICRNPKRFIVNEEEIIKIESAKKIGVESIKHLSKHTNFIQDIDEDTGDVIPSKLLNVLKEETFNTYENRFIFTLIDYMIQFIKQKKDESNGDPRLKDNKLINYVSTTKVGDEKVNVNISLKTALDTSLNKDPKSFNERIKKIEDDIKSLKYTEVYLALEKEGVAFVTNPIKKTNVILKNVNFQYAMKLWDYINKHFSDKNDNKTEKKDYYDQGHLKQLIDETFLLEYLTISTMNKKENDVDLDLKKEQTISRMLDKIIEMNPELTNRQLQEKLGKQFDKIKKVKVSSKKEIEGIFRKYIDRYFEKISNIEF